LAIALVLLSHGRRFLVPFWPQLEALKLGGFLGVELFFVLSGFLIGRILLGHLSGRTSAGWIFGFWLRRWARTLPAYWVYLGLNLLLLFNGWRPSGNFETWRYLTFTQNLFTAHPSFMPEAWSLSVEELFYLGAPVLLACLGFAMPAKRAFVFAAIGVIIFFGGARVAQTLINQPGFDEGLRKIALFRLDAIAVGLLLAWWQEFRIELSSAKRIAAHGLGIACLVATALLAMLPNATIESSLALKLVLFPLASLGSAAFISAGIKLNLNRHLRRCSAKLAALSYSAYLANLPVAAMMQALIGSPADVWQGVGFWAIFIGGTLLLSAMTRHYIERPILRWRDKRTLSTVVTP
jgi:peptidoglycan/LPS O-acetylase OafA/YrhL